MTKSNMIKHHRLNVINNIKQIKICNCIDIDIHRGIDQYKFDMDTSITTATLLTISANTWLNQNWYYNHKISITAIKQNYKSQIHHRIYVITTNYTSKNRAKLYHAITNHCSQHQEQDKVRILMINKITEIL